MRLTVYPVKGDEKWEILSKIIDKLETREVKKALARNGIISVNKGVKILKIIILAMFFELEISYAVSEVNKRLELRKFLRLNEEVNLKSVYKFMSKFEAEQFLNFVFSVLNVSSKRKRRKPSLLILDWTDISLDLNPFRKRDLKNKPYKWGYSTKGFFLGMKMMILIDYRTLAPLFFHVYPANVHESRIYPLILEMLKRRGLIRFGDATIMDKGFYGYKNYLIGVRYGVVPLTIPKKNFSLKKLKGMLSYPLTVFNSKNVEKEKKRYRRLVRRLIDGLKGNLKSLRSIIEDVIKLGKEAYSLRQLHCYSFDSVIKRCSLSVLLIGMTFKLGFREKKVIQKLSEW
ncbi:IS4 family transposase [Geoglobus acetivorans]|uniref:IS4 family transposase n=1 Tax=Geoglobus acetivorans TaxID=565033 RepID=A0A0A7GJL2_GEOAI|nr:IS4 family transposase [Geoglobus acetivorans]